MVSITGKSTKKIKKSRTQLITAVFLSCLIFLCACSLSSSTSTEEVPEITAPPASTEVPENQTDFSSPARDKLVINEVMSYNKWYPAPDGEYYDWIEIKNISKKSINLSDYYLSDKKSKLYKFNLPDVELKAGGIYLIWCDDSCFSISQDEKVYLTDKDGVLQDVMDVEGVGYSYSCGKMKGKSDRYIFETPTPGQENGTGYLTQSEKPVLVEGTDGVFENTESITIELLSRGSIHYTLDGSTPTENSPLYTKPITITKTTVVRAVTFEKRKLHSESLDLSFIMNEGNTLPVTSLIIDPEDFNGKKTGIYNHVYDDWEKPCSIRFIDGDDGFFIRSGIKLHGATSKLKQEKKSYTLKFRDIFDGRLEYDLFGNGVTEFPSVILRSAQEAHISTQIRDILFHELSQQCNPVLSTQDYKFTVLYINGEYWGIYSYREQHSEQHYASHTDYDLKDISMYEEEWPDDSEFEDIYVFALTNDMADDDNYNYVVSHIDLDAFITWALIEGYSGNMDIQPHNVKFYYTESDQKLHIALIDLDLAGFVLSHFPTEVGYKYGFLLNALMHNSGFRELLFQTAHDYLKGPLSDENVFALKESLAGEIADEIPRDAQRWDYKISDWKGDVREILEGNTVNGSVAKNFAKTLKTILNISSDKYEQYFSDIE